MKTLELKQMEMTYGGKDILEDAEACSEFALGVAGAGAGVSAFTSIAGFALSAYCESI